MLSPDTHERTELYGWRLLFGTAGLFAGILAPLAAAVWFARDVATPSGLAVSREWGGIFMAGVILLSAGVTVAATWRRSRDLPAAEGGFSMRDFTANVGGILGNPVFLPFFLAFLIVAMGRTMNSTLALPFYKESLSLNEAVVQGPVLGVFTLCIVLSVPLWTVLGRRLGKKGPAYAGMLVLGVMSIIAYP